MSWASDLSKLRALIGDTSDHHPTFGDPYLNELLDEHNSNIGRAAIAALTRLKNSPDLMRIQYQGLGQFGVNELVALQRSIGEQIKEIREGHLSSVATSSDDSRFPEADVDEVGRSTDEDKWFKESSVETYIQDLDSRIT